ncbi:MAG TPA: alpha-L-arabinofuranosidase C-terminal domain-containing protein [Verrucomicrobiae bacterium]|jgi:alpha-L-arabinofuranosidase
MNRSNNAFSRRLFPILFCLTILARIAFGQATLTVEVNKPTHPVSPTLWGIFFEDINLDADGGIYPELVRNRSFEDAEEPEFWKVTDYNSGKSKIAINSAQPLNVFNRHSLHVTVDGSIAFENEGYWGMNIVNGDTYHFKLAARAAEHFSGPLTIRLLGSTGAELAKGEITDLGKQWNYHTLDLTANGGDPKARLQISANDQGSFFLDMISLMPGKTWKDHGLRTDLAESLDALHPSFMRFPGGNWVEGDDLAHMYHWKYTIGNVDARVPLWNTWGYNTTQGLGYHEYLQLCEDLGAAPLFCVNAGMSLHDNVPLGRMGEWIQDALDAIEYANGPTNSIWGSIRAKNGHPTPFGLKYMEIGNENGGPVYRERWDLIARAIKDKYPDMQLIADVWGGHPGNPTPDIIDEHYYDTPEFFMRQASRYDKYDRSGPKIFIGEYAVTQHAGKGNLRAAIGEAAFMTGMERNSDIVAMASYAPLFVNLNHRAWNPDLINFNSARWYGLPSYYVQQMFSKNRGDVALSTTVDSPPQAAPSSGGGAVGLGSWATRVEYKDLVVTSSDGKTLYSSDFTKPGGTNGWKFLGKGNWSIVDDALRQSSENEFVRGIIGDKSWTDYTLSVKARKLSGAEGFLVLFHVNDENEKTWWNVGGWGNTMNGIEMGEVVTQSLGSVETDRWYDLRVEVAGSTIKCYLDGKLIHDVHHSAIPSLYASATRNTKSGDLILKVVNGSYEKIDTAIHLNGASGMAQNAKSIVLTSESASDENDLDNPTKVSPKTETIDVASPNFNHTFPGNSLTILRITSKR